MDDVTMRLGFYVMNLISISALAAVFAPWIFAYRNQNRFAAFFAILPVLLICLAILAFFTLDNWLNRTFSSTGVSTFIAARIAAEEHA
jgi:sterol desaturase/sphingolipid hydroxylase (fatty acid hydroxylase superfamily)